MERLEILNIEFGELCEAIIVKEIIVSINFHMNRLISDIVEKCVFKNHIC